MTTYATTTIQETIAAFVDLLRPHCVELLVCGSVRRGKVEVHDVELVAMPRESLLPFLDKLVADDVIAKALYGSGAKQTARWGSSYRGMVYAGVKFELFTYDVDNRGYIQFLRTGPGDANTVIMTALGNRSAPFGFATWAYFGKREWKKGKREFVPDVTRKLRLHDERDMFALLGLPYIEPADRSEQTYKRLLNARGHAFGDPAQFLIAVPATTRALFDDTDAPAPAHEPTPQRVWDLDMASVPLYREGSSFAEESEMLTRVLLALNDFAAATEQEVLDFSYRRYRHWLLRQWKAVGR